ncbi:MAG: hypothetical protein ACREYE_18025 [Gammaproteobacteria bacterium]
MSRVRFSLLQHVPSEGKQERWLVLNKLALCVGNEGLYPFELAPFDSVPASILVTKISPVEPTASPTKDRGPSGSSGPCVGSPKSLSRLRVPFAGSTRKSAPLDSVPALGSVTKIWSEASIATPKGSAPCGPWPGSPKSLSTVRVPLPESTRHNAPFASVPALVSAMRI